MRPHPWLRSPVPAVLGLLLSLDAAAGKPKFATLDMAKAFEAYHLTVTARAQVQEARKTLQQDPRHETIKLLDVELRDLKDHVEDPTFTEAQRKDYYRRYMMKNHERLSLKRQHEQHHAEQLNLINKGMVENTRKLLHDVRAIVQEIAGKDGFDYVFEVSGKTSSQLSSLLYIRNAIDLTDRVIEELNRNRPNAEVSTSSGGQSD